MKPGYELAFPTAQNAIDLIPGWTSLFPPQAGVKAGAMNLFDDPRMSWAIEKFGSVAGKKVLELGPLEGGHTTTLVRHGAHVDAVEASREAYLKCLITKEILQLQNVRFLLGDCLLWAEQSQLKYDLVVACGVLYHMVEPLRLLRALAKLADDFYLWTVYLDNDSLAPTKVETFEGLKVRTYNIPYGPKKIGFTGGAPPSTNWMAKADILAVLQRLGFDSVEVAHDRTTVDKISPATFSVYARRSARAAG